MDNFVIKALSRFYSMPIEKVVEMKESKPEVYKALFQAYDDYLGRQIEK